MLFFDASIHFFRFFDRGHSSAHSFWVRWFAAGINKSSGLHFQCLQMLIAHEVHIVASFVHALCHPVNCLTVENNVDIFSRFNPPLPLSYRQRNGSSSFSHSKRSGWSSFRRRIASILMTSEQPSKRSGVHVQCETGARRRSSHPRSLAAPLKMAMIFRKSGMSTISQGRVPIWRNVRKAFAFHTTGMLRFISSRYSIGRQIRPCSFRIFGKDIFMLLSKISLNWREEIARP